MSLRKTILAVFCTLLLAVASVSAQETAPVPAPDPNSVENLFMEQFTAFPQEKIYVQTDKPAYVTGETMWMRIHLVDGVMLQQANASRYVYVELLNPLADVVERLMIRPDSLGHFHTNLPVDEEWPEGSYTLRAYTRFMQNQDDEYLFRKTIDIIDPLSATLSPRIDFSFDNRTVEADIHYVDAQGNRTILPEDCAVVLNGDDVEGEGRGLSVRPDSTARYSFRADESGRRDVLLLQTTYNGRVHKRFFPVSFRDDQFDVSFFPEGGRAPLSTDIQMAFKALNANGLSEQVSGIVYDDTGRECAAFESTHLGMGVFRMYYLPERTYHAVCTTAQGISKRFDLPPSSVGSAALKVLSDNDDVRVAVVNSPDYRLPAQTRLVAQMRGVVLYSELWNETQGFVTFDKEFFPAGIVHFLLIDGERNILSERLAFSMQKSTFANVAVTSDKDNYGERDKVNLRIALTDEEGIPLSGNFSVSVVDKHDVAIDTLTNIISTLLLTSELKGHIESPMSYLKLDDRVASRALDVLMMTQGWRKYDVPAVLKGEITRDLEYPLETSQVVSGSAHGGLSPTRDGDLSLMARRDTVTLGTALTRTDSRGRFEFRDLEYPDGTWFFVQAKTNKGGDGVFLEVDSLPPFPPAGILPQRNPQKSEQLSLKTEVVEKSNNKYTLENGARIINIATVTVTARRPPPQTSSPYYSVNVSKVITEEDIDERTMFTVYDLLRRLPGVSVIGSTVQYRGQTPLVILDDVPREEFDFSELNISDIGDVFASPPETMGIIFGPRGANGAIVVNTKHGFLQKNTLNRNMAVLRPLGYRQAVEFYSPVYETAIDREKVARDYRSTIYWKPDVVLTEESSGVATLTFYAADAASEYGVVIEGTSNYGHLIYSGDGVVNRK